LYDAAGALLGTGANPIITTATTSDLVPGSVGTYSAASFRIAGVAATSQVLMTLRNNAGARDIAIRRLAIDVSYSAAAVDLVQAYFRYWGNTGVTPSGGAAATKHKLDSEYPDSQAATELLFAASGDGVAATITHATPGSNPTREQAKANILTAVGTVPNINDYELINYSQHPLLVRTGETACLILVGSAVDVVTRHYTVKTIWEEFTP
jgi:hypothetical protein